MKHTIASYAIAFGLLGGALASPAPAPQDHDTPFPNPSLTFSLRDPEVTDFNTQNTSAPTTTGSNHHTSAAPSLTEIASFTAPNGAKYGATAIDGTVRIAGYELYAGGPDALVGGVRVSVVDDGLVHDGTTANYAEVTGLVTSAVISTTTDEAGSTEVVSSSSTVAVAESTGSASATESESESGTSASESANGTAESATGGAAVGATAKSKSAVSALVGIAGLLCVLA